jgi:hypothetical protein
VAASNYRDPFFPQEIDLIKRVSRDRPVGRPRLRTTAIRLSGQSPPRDPVKRSRAAVGRGELPGWQVA